MSTRPNGIIDSISVSQLIFGSRSLFSIIVKWITWQSYVKGSSFWVLPTNEHQRQQAESCRVWRLSELMIQWFRPRNQALGVTSSQSLPVMKSLAQPMGNHLFVTINPTQWWLARGAGSSSKTTRPTGKVVFFETGNKIKNETLATLTFDLFFWNLTPWRGSRCSDRLPAARSHHSAPSKWWSERDY